MKHVIIGSTTQAKIDATRDAFAQLYPHEQFIYTALKVPTGIRPQPITPEETLTGACNRVHNARVNRPDGDFYVGIEAGLDGDLTFAWLVVEDQQGLQGRAKSAGFPLPPRAMAKLAQGAELGNLLDELFHKHNVKQMGGAIGELTGHRLSRASTYRDAMMLALIPLNHPDLYRS
ncbi:non-canonical purine NTP phosphatase [Shewanella sp. NFH-SH190041]|uniref:inosine/xanthosine triphosphatase n=1 Tax=Shewanella sp. NFH-SH190041 TaxID=2950245 RepID=UPI0021C3DFDA|nr:inosine/xanthosine triphosphatase [Shewanella sp. NFH-SH190041]BDM65722.1 non-canonical purine NTP phosphatase [Shewanella sp. NFH-SH190041]